MMNSSAQETDGLGEIGITAFEGFAVAGEETDFAVVLDGLDTIAVELELVLPLVAGGQNGDRLALHGRDEVKGTGGVLHSKDQF